MVNGPAMPAGGGGQPTGGNKGIQVGLRASQRDAGRAGAADRHPAAIAGVEHRRLTGNRQAQQPAAGIRVSQADAGQRGGDALGDVLRSR